MGRRKTGWKNRVAWLLMPAAVAIVLLGFASALDSLDEGRTAEDRKQLEETLRRTCVACYAAEGVYPPNLDYLKEHYGIQVNEERYTVRYDAFAENLMPDITVLENTR